MRFSRAPGRQGRVRTNYARPSLRGPVRHLAPAFHRPLHCRGRDIWRLPLFRRVKSVMKIDLRCSRLLPALAAAAVFIATCTITRIALALRPEFADLEAGVIARGFAYGFGFDLAAAAYAFAAFVLWLVLAPARIARWGAYRAVSVAGFFAASFAALLLGVAEWLFWVEF